MTSKEEVPVLNGSLSATGNTENLSWSYDFWNSVLSSTSGHYELEQYSISATEGFTKVYTSPYDIRTSPSFHQITLPAPCTYYFRVKAYDMSIFSSFSNVIAVIYNESPQIQSVLNPDHDNFLLYSIENSALQNTVYQGLILQSGRIMQ